MSGRELGNLGTCGSGDDDKRRSRRRGPSGRQEDSFMEMCSGAALVTDKQWALLPEEPFVMRCGSFCGPRTLSSGRHSKAREKTDIAKSFLKKIDFKDRIRRMAPSMVAIKVMAQAK